MVVSIRVPPSLTSAAVGRLGETEFVAAHGVGEVTAAIEGSALGELRDWAESSGGTAVITEAPEEMYAEADPWGAPPSTVALQRRIKAAFDPAGILVPGRLPGGV